MSLNTSFFFFLEGSGNEVGGKFFFKEICSRKEKKIIQKIKIEGFERPSPDSCRRGCFWKTVFNPFTCGELVNGNMRRAVSS